MENQNFGVHITYDQKITLKELSEVLNLINLSINDYYREKGINNFQIGRLAPSVTGVKEGSIFFDIVIPVIETICSEAITVETIMAHILNRLNRPKQEKSRQTHIYVTFNIGKGNTININVGEKSE